MGKYSLWSASAIVIAQARASRYMNLLKVHAPSTVTVQVFEYPGRKPAALLYTMLQVNLGTVARPAGSGLAYHSTIRDDLQPVVG